MKKTLWLIPAYIAAIVLYIRDANPLIMTALTLTALTGMAATMVRYEKDINEQTDCG